MEYQYYEDPIEVEQNEKPQKQVFGIIGLICGIVSLVSCYAGFPFAIAAFVMSALDSSQNAVPTGRAKTGKILGIFGIIVSAISLIAYIVLVVIGEMSMYGGSYF